MGGKQLGFSDYALTTAKMQTKREKFLSEMETVVPWQSQIFETVKVHCNARAMAIRPGKCRALRRMAKNRCKVNVIAAPTNLSWPCVDY